MQQSKSHIIASIGTVIFLILCFLLLWFIYLEAPHVEEDEGIMVAFGYAEEGGGVGEQPAAMLPEKTVAPPPVQQTPSNNDLMTQDDEESLALAKQTEEEKRKKAADAERIRKQKEAEAAAEAERIAREKALAEQRAKEQKAIENANKLGGLFGNAPSGATGSGDSAGEGVKGNPVGKGTIGGNSWSLNGRNLRGTLAKPAAAGVQEGKVVVEIRVNAQGKVVSATIGNGTTISERVTQRAALEAAQKAVFSEGKGDVVGTITYTFKNN